MPFEADHEKDDVTRVSLYGMDPLDVLRALLGASSDGTATKWQQTHGTSGDDTPTQPSPC